MDDIAKHLPDALVTRRRRRAPMPQATCGGPPADPHAHGQAEQSDTSLPAALTLRQCLTVPP